MKQVISSKKDTVSGSQLAILAAMGLFSPIIRLLPKAATQVAGTAAYLAPLAAIPVVALFLVMSCSFAKSRLDGEGLADVIIRILGNVCGKAVCVIFLLWFIFYASVILRSSGERLLSTIYPGGSLWIFLPITSALAFMGAWGKIKSLANTSQIFLKLLLAVLLFVFLFTVPQVSKNNLLPVSYLDTLPVLTAGVLIANVLSPMSYVLFLAFAVEKKDRNFRMPWLLCLMLIITVFFLIFSIVGNFGAQFTNNMQSPFFSMIHNIKIFNTVERFEAVVVALWVLTDFVFLSFLFTILKTVSGKVLRLRNNNPSLFIITPVVLLTAIFMENDSFSFMYISEALCPFINACFTFILLPIIWLIGKLRKKI